MKKVLLGIIAIISISFLVLIIGAMLYEDDIKAHIKVNLDNTINADAEIDDISLSFISSFPNAEISIVGISLKNRAPFEGNTLCSIKELQLKADIMGLIKSLSDNKPIGIKALKIIGPEINALVTKDGQASWDIVKSDDSELAEEESTEEGAEMNLKMEQFEIQNANIKYIDESSGLSNILEDFNFSLSGNLGTKQTDLDLSMDIAKTSFSMDKISYLKNADINFEASIKADLEKMLFTLEQNNFQLNTLTLNLQGFIGLIEDDINMDLTWSAPSNEIKQMLYLVPEAFQADLQGAKSSGTLNCKGSIKGTYNETTIPDFMLVLKLDNGQLQYPDLPKNIDNINIDLTVNCNNNSLDNLKVDLKQFALTVGENPFSMSFKLDHPISDPHFDINLKNEINLTSLKESIPLDSKSGLSGNIKSDIHLDGTQSAIDSEDYKALNINGELLINAFKIKMSDFDYTIEVPSLASNFTSKAIKLEKCQIKLGKTDLDIFGEIQNYLSYATQENTSLGGQIKLKSKLIDCDQLLGEDTLTVEEEEPLEVYPLPEDINLKIEVSLNKIIFDGINYDVIQGKAELKEGVLYLNQSSMNLYGSHLDMNGEYNTLDPKSPYSKGDIQMTSLDLNKLPKHFPNIAKKYPALKQLGGSCDVYMNLECRLDSGYMPILNSISSKGTIASKGMQIENSKLMTNAQKLLKVPNQSNAIKFKDQNIKYTLLDGTLYLEPIDFELDDIKGKVSGKQTLDQDIDYVSEMLVPLSYLGGSAASMLQGLNALTANSGVNTNVSDPMKVRALITGTIDDPKINLDLSSEGKSPGESVKDNLKKELEAKKKELEAKAKAEADRLKAEAEQKKKELENKAKAEAEKKKKAAEAKAKAEAEKKKKAAEAKAKSEAEKAKKKAKDEAKNKLKGLFDK